jgi:hypothetical protein
MKRFCACLASAFLGSMIAGCGGGLEEGVPNEIPKDDTQRKAAMLKDVDKMKSVKKPDAPPAEKKPDTPPAEK